MDKNRRAYRTIDEYIQSCPGNAQAKLKQLRSLIRRLVPEALEKISYQMPTFYLKGNLVHFAAYQNHIGLYPTPSGIEKFRKELSRYKSSKGAVQFPLAEPLPVKTIERIVKFRVRESLAQRGKRSSESGMSRARRARPATSAIRTRSTGAGSSHSTSSSPKFSSR